MRASEVVTCTITRGYQYIYLIKRQNRLNLPDTQTDRQPARLTGQLAKDHHDLFSLFGLDSPGIRSECLEGSSYIQQPSPARDLKVSSCRGSTSELLAFTGSTQVNVRDLKTLRTVLLYELSS